MTRRGQHRLFTLFLLAAGLTSVHAVDTTYYTIDVPGAVGFGPNVVDSFIRGDGTDVDLNAVFGTPPAYANPNGDLGYAFNFNLPFSQFDNIQHFDLTATLPQFVVTTDGVTVYDWEFSGVSVGSNLTNWTLSDVITPSTRMDINSDGTMTATWTTLFQLDGSPGSNFTTETSDAAGLYILNQPGRDDATAIDSPPLLYPTGADYLNFVRDEYLNGDGIQKGGLDWSQAGIWFFTEEYTLANTTGTSAPFVIGGSYVGYHVWYTDNPWLYGNPLGDPTPGDAITLDDLAQMIADNVFPDTVGIVLPGEGAVQVWDIDLQSGDGSPQEVVFEYDPAQLPLGFDELSLRIAHYIDGVWDIPPNQIVDLLANTVTLTVDDFSPFALTAVPVPPAVYMLGSAMALLWARRRRL